MTTRAECEQYVGKWVHFRTKYGYHVGLIEKVSNDCAIVLSLRQHIPAQLVSTDVSADEMKRLDLALAWGGLGGGYPGAGYGAGAPGAGAYGGWGGRGFGGWGWGWGRWAVSFLIIYVLWGLWWW